MALDLCIACSFRRDTLIPNRDIFGGYHFCYSESLHGGRTPGDTDRQEVRRILSLGYCQRMCCDHDRDQMHRHLERDFFVHRKHVCGYFHAGDGISPFEEGMSYAADKIM